MVAIRLPRLQLRAAPECRMCGSSRRVRDRRCPECRTPHPLEKRLASRGWTIAELARRAGVTPMTIHLLLRGEDCVSDDVRERLGAVLRLPPDGLLRVRP